MQKKLQVFVSSTYEDMKDERQAVVNAILRAKHIPAGMELFTAGDESQMEVIRQWIDDSDVFMLIVGGRYGCIEEKSGKSYIELEYDYAVKTNKPYFCAVASESYVKEKGQKDLNTIERLYGQKLEDFKQRVKKKMCAFFNNVDQLKLIVYESLGDIEKTHDLPGWISGRDVVNPKPLLDEIAKLKEENADLRHRAKRVQRPETPEDIARSLTTDARRLLRDVASRDTTIEFADSGMLYVINIGREETVSASEVREIAHWREVANQLKTGALLDMIVGGGGLMYMPNEAPPQTDKLYIKWLRSSL